MILKNLFLNSTKLIGLTSPNHGIKSKIMEKKTEQIVNFFKKENDLISFNISIFTFL